MSESRGSFLPVRKTLFAVAVALSLAACKKPQPSQDFADASQKFAALYGQKLDEAYADPQMDPILDQLKKVPADSLDADAAKQLISRIETGRAQQRANQEKLAAASKAALTPTAMPNFGGGTAQVQQQPQVQQPETAQDAGMAQNRAIAPRPGMTSAEFEKSFGDCFDYGPTIYLGGAGTGPADSRTLKDLNRCKDLLPGFESRYVLFQNGAVVTIMDKSAIQSVTVGADGGMVDGGR